jgi:hypothetical protein
MLRKVANSKGCPNLARREMEASAFPAGAAALGQERRSGHGRRMSGSQPVRAITQNAQKEHSRLGPPERTMLGGRQLGEDGLSRCHYRLAGAAICCPNFPPGPVLPGPSVEITVQWASPPAAGGPG